MLYPLLLLVSLALSLVYCDGFISGDDQCVSDRCFEVKQQAVHAALQRLSSTAVSHDDRFHARRIEEKRNIFGNLSLVAKEMGLDVTVHTFSDARVVIQELVLLQAAGAQSLPGLSDWKSFIFDNDVTRRACKVLNLPLT
jgi:hypothetical protein